MDFNLVEKLAIVKLIDKVILADKVVAKEEMAYLGQLMKLLDIDSHFVEEARKFNMKQANLILENLSEPKKHSIAIMMYEMAYADGEMDKKEMDILFSVFENVGIKIAKAENIVPVFDVSDVYFKSSKHIITNEKNKRSEIINEDCAIKIEPHINGDKGVSLTIFKMGHFLQFWGNKILLSPKQMEVFELGNSRSILKGYDSDNLTNSEPEKKHTNYRLSIHHPGQKIEKIILEKHHSCEYIEYLK